MPIDPDTGLVKDESKLCEQGRNFCNKMWNALRLIKGWEVREGAGSEDEQVIRRLAGDWIEYKFSQTLQKVESNFAEYRLSDALMALYKFIWDDFCSWYLEMIKPEFGDPVDPATLERSIALFEKMMTALHPFMPFVTEELWHQLKPRREGEDCIVATWPEGEKVEGGLVSDVERAKDVVASIRDLRNHKGIKMKDALNVSVQDSVKAKALFSRPGLREMIAKMAHRESLVLRSTEPANAVSFLSGTEKYFVELQQNIDAAAECERLQKELEYQQGFLRTVEKKLGNERFVANAPAQVVDRERKKLADSQTKIQNLEEALTQLGCGGGL